MTATLKLRVPETGSSQFYHRLCKLAREHTNSLSVDKKHI